MVSNDATAMVTCIMSLLGVVVCQPQTMPDYCHKPQATIYYVTCIMYSSIHIVVSLIQRCEKAAV
jgi:hypothetical protein